ncbi:MAG TPA: hypothetical protein VN408_41890 [Actinoplanes sp.]|nr:hypothetical protein [Actinoplanes sp.]
MIGDPGTLVRDRLTRFERFHLMVVLLIAYAVTFTVLAAADHEPDLRRPRIPETA